MRPYHFLMFPVLLALLGLSGTVSAQYADCTPDYSVQDPEGVGVRDPVDLPVAFAGEYYSTVFTIIAPRLANTWGSINLKITKIQVTELVGLPGGLNQDSNAGNDDGYLYGGEYYCYTLDGYPNATPGIHNVDVYANAWIRVIFEMQAPGNPQFGGTIYFTICNELDLDLGQDIITYSESEDVITLNANQNTSYHTYAWSNGCTDPSITLTGNELGVGEHQISVIVTDTVGTTGKYEGREPRCFKTDTITVTVLEGNSVSVEKQHQIKVYPNPAKNFIKFEQPAHLFNTNYTISNLKSEIVLQGKLVQTETELNTSNLPSGVYIISFSSDKINEHCKLVIK